MTNQINFNQAQLEHIGFLTNNAQADFHLAYAFISNIIKDSPQVDTGTKYWFAGAAQINDAGSNAAASVFVRGITDLGLNWNGLLPADMQQLSDSIGSSGPGTRSRIQVQGIRVMSPSSAR